MALKVTRTVLNEAISLRDSGDIAGAWDVLGQAGDLYAASAYDIIAQIEAPMSIFDKIVRTHWERVAPGTRQTSFMDVGYQHLSQYLALIDADPSGTTPAGEQQYLLPNTEEIENSYGRKGVKALIPMNIVAGHCCSCI